MCNQYEKAEGGLNIAGAGRTPVSPLADSGQLAVGQRQTAASICAQQAQRAETHAATMRYLESCLKLNPPTPDVEMELWDILASQRKRY